MDTKVPVHIYSEHWKRSSECGSEERVGGQDRRRKDGVGVDQIVGSGEEDEDETKAEEATGDDRANPVDVRRIYVVLAFTVRQMHGDTHWSTQTRTCPPALRQRQPSR